MTWIWLMDDRKCFFMQILLILKFICNVAVSSYDVSKKQYVLFNRNNDNVFIMTQNKRNVSWECKKLVESLQLKSRDEDMSLESNWYLIDFDNTIHHEHSRCWQNFCKLSLKTFWAVFFAHPIAHVFRSLKTQGLCVRSPLFFIFFNFSIFKIQLNSCWKRMKST